jgi:hypothetical protein
MASSACGKASDQWILPSEFEMVRIFIKVTMQATLETQSGAGRRGELSQSEHVT